MDKIVRDTKTRACPLSCEAEYISWLLILKRFRCWVIIRYRSLRLL
ncbi:hypothetical protein PG_0815 [Porphyromonas gingivalis W83]|uniref:Uncharacterized protein n=1 Tax=Porphyromonas gingivalis (strain ATCC BAA-308 / W83) TaxID=242619 RepID=Q7MW34_PORGI|nr:hypothetical protein PG_0815 [Porphyromonas gingivalis W83]